MFKILLKLKKNKNAAEIEKLSSCNYCILFNTFYLKEKIVPQQNLLQEEKLEGPLTYALSHYLVSAEI